MGGSTIKTIAASASLCLGLLLATQSDGRQPRDESWRPLFIDGGAVQWRAGDDGPGRVLSYAFATEPRNDPDAANCREMKPLVLRDGTKAAIAHRRVRQAANEAFTRWSRVAPIAFVEIDDAAAADIVLGAQVEAAGIAFTNVALGETIDAHRREIRRASICINPERHWKVGFDGDLSTYDLVHVLTHEIGHALGLDHPGARGAVMAFRYDESRPGLAEGDIQGVRALYGTR